MSRRIIPTANERMTIHVKFDPLESIDANSDAAAAVLALADSIEAKLTQCTEILLDGNYHPAARELLEVMINCTSSMRALVAGQDVVNVDK
jgi:hypothetical protein